MLCERHLGRPMCLPTAAFIEFKCFNFDGTIEKILRGATSTAEAMVPVISWRCDSHAPSVGTPLLSSRRLPFNWGRCAEDVVFAAGLPLGAGRLVYGQFPKFHRVLLGRDLGTLKSDIV